MFTSLEIMGYDPPTVCSIVYRQAAHHACSPGPSESHTERHTKHVMDYRVFMHRWTVNWKMLPERMFLHPVFAKVLLALHALLLLLFMQLRWMRARGGIINATSSFLCGGKGCAILPPRVILSAVLTSNYIGIVCSRSLHYQFYSWYFHGLPFLLWQTQLPLAVRVTMLIAIEVCWNVFPASPLSSSVLLACHVLLLAALGLAPVHL
jgi:alpha-1,3-mannosyltransferase